MRCLAVRRFKRSTGIAQNSRPPTTLWCSTPSLFRVAQSGPENISKTACLPFDKVVHYVRMRWGACAQTCSNQVGQTARNGVFHHRIYGLPDFLTTLQFGARCAGEVNSQEGSLSPKRVLRPAAEGISASNVSGFPEIERNRESIFGASVL